MSSRAVFPPTAKDIVQSRTMDMSLPFPHLPNELKEAIIAYSPHSLRPTIALVYHPTKDTNSPADLNQNSNSPANCIFTELNLTLSAHYGRYPLTPLSSPRNRREAALTNKLTMFIGAATVQKLGMVRAVKIESCPAVTILNMAILSLVQANLRELEIVGTPLHLPGAPPIPHYAQTLDTTLLTFPLSFPKLELVRMGPRSSCFFDFCTLICNYASSVQVVDVNFDQYPVVDDNGMFEQFPSISNPSKITQLRVTCSGDGDEDPRDILADYVRCGPLLTQVILSSDLATRFAGLVAAMKVHTSVRDLCWSIGAHHLALRVRMEAWWMAPPGLSGVKRLVVSLDQWVDIVSSLVSVVHQLIWWYDALPPMPDLERLYLDFSFSLGAISMPVTSLSTMPVAPPPSSMIPDFAANLRLNSKLRTIHILRSPLSSSGFSLFDQLDEIEHGGDFSGYITSTVHDGDELLHARLLQDVVEIADGPIVPDPSHPTHLHTVKHYLAAGRTPRSRTYERRAGFAWVHYTDFEGLLVPFHVIAEMKRVEGGDVDWEKRGVEVGKEAWQVLLDWQKEVLG